MVDDESTVRRLFRQALEDAGFRVEEAADGRTALDRARALLPDLILLDILLPDLDGFDVAAALRADPTTANIPIITVSAVGDGSDRIGIDRFFTKPVDLEELEAEIEALIDAGSGLGTKPELRVPSVRPSATDREVSQ